MLFAVGHGACHPAAEECGWSITTNSVSSTPVGSLVRPGSGEDRADMGKKRTTSKMDVDDAAPTQQKEEEAKGGDADGAEDMTTQGLTGKEKKKAEWLTRQQLKQKVGAIKKERCGPQFLPPNPNCQRRMRGGCTIPLSSCTAGRHCWFRGLRGWGGHTAAVLGMLLLGAVRLAISCCLGWRLQTAT